MSRSFSDIGRDVGRALGFGGLKGSQAQVSSYGSHRASSDPARDNARTPLRNEKRIRPASEMPRTLSQCPANFSDYRFNGQVIASGNINGERERFIAAQMIYKNTGVDGAGSEVTMVCSERDLRCFEHPQAELASAKMTACYNNNYANGAVPRFASAMPEKNVTDRRVAGRQTHSGAGPSQQDRNLAFFKKMNNPTV